MGERYKKLAGISFGLLCTFVTLATWLPPADANAQGIRAFAEIVAHDPRLRGTAIQTVGRKGYDGFAVVVVGS